ncbi:MAG: ion channel [Povalibacter sp.]
MKRSIGATRDALRRLFFQRCFYLFVTLITFVAIAPFIEPAPGRLLIRNLINAFVMLSAVAAVGRSMRSFLVVTALIVPALVLRWLAMESNLPMYLDLSLRLDLAVYAVTIVLLLRYVFERSTITADRLWGAAAVYVMIGVLWGFIFAVVDRTYPGSFAVRGTVEPLSLHDLLYFSFSTLTTTGFGDIITISPVGKMAATLEGIFGQLFIAILIAKLVGVYPPRVPQEEETPEESPENVAELIRDKPAAARASQEAA